MSEVSLHQDVPVRDGMPMATQMQAIFQIIQCWMLVISAEIQMTLPLDLGVLQQIQIWQERIVKCKNVMVVYIDFKTII